MADYLGLPVFEFEPREVIAPDQRNDFFVRGQVWQTQDKVTREIPERSIEFVLLQKDQSERVALRAFFDGRQGRLLPFWIKSYITDYRTTQLATAAEINIFTRTEFGVSEFLVVTRHIFIPETGDFRRVAGASQNPLDNKETILTLDSGISADLPIGSEIQNLYFVRFENDSLRIETNGIGVVPNVTTSAVLRFRELQRETPDA